MTGEMRTLLEQAASGDRDAEARLIEDMQYNSIKEQSYTVSHRTLFV